MKGIQQMFGQFLNHQAEIWLEGLDPKAREASARFCGFEWM